MKVQVMRFGPCYRRNLVASKSMFPAYKGQRVGKSVWVATVLLGTLCLFGCGKSARQYLDRGNQLFAAKKYDDAILNYRNAIKKSPETGEAHYRLGLALLRQGKVNDAYQAFSSAVRLDPKNNPAKVDLANLCLAVYAVSYTHLDVYKRQIP